MRVNIRYRLFIVFLLISSFSFGQGIEQYFPPKPNPPRLVVDQADFLTPDQQNALERKLVAYDDSTSNQILIVTKDDIGDYDISDYAVALGRAWGVGGKQFNNGIVVVVLIDKARNKRSVWIATGYGLEGAIPDITAKQIIENNIIPRFKESDIYRGLDDGTNALIKAAAGEYKAPEGYGRGKGRARGVPILVIIMIIIILIIGNINRRGGGGMLSRRGYRRWNRTPPIWWFPGGGFGGGRSGGGGGFGGGGFGGFGGGSFGGGGAGGNW